MRVHHNRRMNRNVEVHFADKIDDGKILHQNCIRFNFAKSVKIFFQKRNFFRAYQVVQSHINFYFAPVSGFDDFLQSFVVKIEIVSMNAHIEMFSAEIDGIGSGIDCRDKCFPSSGRCQKFDGISV